MVKKYGFTLGEVLVAILIIGIIAVLALPSLIKSLQEKSKMALLKNTVATIGATVQNELTQFRTTEIPSTDIYKNPKIFIKKLSGTKSGKPFAASYRRYSDSKTAEDVLIPSDDNEGQAVILMKNGVGIGIVNDTENSRTSFVVDVTGEDKPNMVGVDYFILKLEWEDGNGHRAGDVTSYDNGGTAGSETAQSLKTSCYGGNGAACFRMVELSAYDPSYLN